MPQPGHDPTHLGLQRQLNQVGRCGGHAQQLLAQLTKGAQRQATQAPTGVQVARIQPLHGFKQGQKSKSHLRQRRQSASQFRQPAKPSQLAMQGSQRERHGHTSAVPWQAQHRSQLVIKDSQGSRQLETFGLQQRPVEQPIKQGSQGLQQTQLPGW